MEKIALSLAVFMAFVALVVVPFATEFKAVAGLIGKLLAGG